MKKILGIIVGIIILSKIVFAEVDFKKLAIPQDGLNKPYSSLVGYDETSKRWKLIKIKQLPDGQWIYDGGTTTVMGEVFISPRDWVSTATSTEISTTGSATWTFNPPASTQQLAWLTIFDESDTETTDYISYELYIVKGGIVYTIMGGLITPASSQGFFKIPEPLKTNASDTVKIIVKNKGSGDKKIRIACMFQN